MSLEPNPVPEFERAYRVAFRALRLDVRRRDPDGGARGQPGRSLVARLRLRHVFDGAMMAFAVERGPFCLWRGDHDDWSPVTLVVDCDTDEHTNANEAGELLWDGDDFPGSGLGRAASAYRRECGWDFPPGDAGVWLVAACPYSAFRGGTEEWTISGNLAAFAVLHDRDDDGRYESLAHVWTARGWRRRGLAARLLHEAYSRFGVTEIEHPMTDDGDALIKASPPAEGGVPLANP